MSDTIAVSAADVRIVNEVLFTAAAAFGGSLQHIPHFGDAMEAVTRMASASQQATMPEDPVSGMKSLAIAYHEMMRDFTDAGFDEHQAMELVKIQASATAQLTTMRALHG